MIVRAVQARGVAAGLPVQQPSRCMVPRIKTVEEQEMTVPAGDHAVFMGRAPVVPATAKARQVGADQGALRLRQETPGDVPVHARYRGRGGYPQILPPSIGRGDPGPLTAERE